MTRIEVLLENNLAGWLTHEPATNQFSFTYAPTWIKGHYHYPLSPQLPLNPDPTQAPALHSAIVRQFFENLLPEGRALDEAAAASGVAKSNLVGLMIALGRETSGALSLRLDQADRTPDAASETRLETKRLLTPGELSKRMRERPYEPFSVWDGRVRLSIAGYQDKIAVYEESGEWYLVEGDRLASTVILKPEPVNSNLAGLVSNEFFCMRLAESVGLGVAEAELVKVPEPVLAVQRFDRLREPSQVHRLHVIDGCQALGLAPALKYERPYGNGPDVRHIRDGASFPRLFEFTNACSRPAADRLRLLRWAIFQVLIGNTDAHAKNVSFFCVFTGIGMAPAYDLVCTLAFNDKSLDDTYAMAIGDAFHEKELTAFEWANFAASCKLRSQFVATELKRMLALLTEKLAVVAKQCIEEGADPEVVERVSEVIKRITASQEVVLPKIVEVDMKQFLN